MLIPIGHEETTVRRWPWVSFAIIGLCLLALILTQLSPSADPARLAQRYEQALRYFFEHPYLELQPDMKKRLYEGVREDEAEALHEVVKQFGGTPPADPRERAAQQAELDRLFQEAQEAMEAHPFFRWGLVPAHIEAHALITHMFMHAGWFHLLGNMFIFYLCGPFLEDVWGRPLFITFYLSAGVVAALAFVAHYPHSGTPLVGASGAVAGCMGAFLVRYWNTHIRFFYWFGVVFRGTFSAPAWIMLPLWLAREFLFANAMDVGGAPGGGQVAHWAHVWGFVFGLGVAGAISFFKLEQRFLTPALENKVTLASNPEVDQAHEVFDQGNKDRAFEIMSGVVRKDPANVDAVLSLWGFAREAGRSDEVAPAMMGIVRDEVRSGDMELAVSHWLEVAHGAPRGAADLGIGTRVLEYLIENGRLEEARYGVAVLSDKVDPSSPPGVLTRLARVAMIVGGVDAPIVLNAAVGSADIPEDQREEFRRALAELPGGVTPARAADDESEQVHGGPESGDDEEQEAQEALEVAEVWQQVKTLQVVEGLPLGLSATEIKIGIANKGERAVPFDQVQAVAVAGIKGSSRKPFLVLDLLLDSLWSSADVVRLIRCTSLTFDPRKLLGLEGAPVEGFRALVDIILKGSEGAPLPGPDQVMGKPFAVFESLADYEREVLGASRSTSS